MGRHRTPEIGARSPLLISLFEIADVGPVKMQTLADAAGVMPSNVSSWRNGVYDPSLKYVEAMAGALGYRIKLEKIA
jgi:transcriptional regulator with XRE-family HTH domain